MARYVLLFFVLILGTTTVVAQSSTSTLEGIVTDAESGEGLIGASVTIYKSGGTTPVKGASTDIDGSYSIPSVDPGTYDVEFSYVGYTSEKKTGVLLYANQVIRLNVKLMEGVTVGKEVVITGYDVPLISQDKTTTGKTITADDIKNLPSKNISGIVATTAGATSADDGGAVNIRGSRSNATIVYVDGMRVNGSTVPQTEVEQMEVMTGGISAAYGDATGGVISITTKGPSERFTGNFEVENSNYLDPYGYFLGYGSVSGPIWKKDGKSIIGFRSSIQYLRNGDRSPTATGVYKLKDDVHADLVAHPVTTTENGTAGTPKALYLTEDDVELAAARPNSATQRVDINGKIDVRVNDAIDMSFGGSYIFSEGRGTTGSLTNFHNSNYSTNLQYRGYGRFRHKVATDEKSLIRNLGYTLQFSYEHREGETMDNNHRDRLFDYGYVGRFDVEEQPLVGIIAEDTTATLRVIGYQYPITGFTGGTQNAGLAAYNEGITDFTGGEEGFNALNGRPLSDLGVNVYGFHANVNEISDRYTKFDNNQYQFNLSGSFEIVPGGNDKGRHSITFGLLYEQRENRSYRIDPRALWQVGKQLLNAQFNGVDTNQVNGYLERPNLFGGIDSIPIHPWLAQDDIWASEDPANRTSDQTYFDNSVRTKFGFGRSEYINMDALSPDDLSLDMFSADELLDDFGDMGYFGYDYLGNPLRASQVSFGDFFTATDANGNKTRPVLPNTPIYTAAYIQDKFRYKDIIFRVGLRVDRYDANTQVLKDNYSLFETYTAADYAANNGISNPSNIGNDFVVYENNPGEVSAYRDGDQWYKPDGEIVNNPLLIFGTTQATPALVNPDIDDPRDPGYNWEGAFKDATPQVVVMPRLSFSFPIIEDKAGFFAHYDVLTQRPPSNTLATPLTYFNFRPTVQAGGNLNNPNLRPERTIDYQVGFQQRLNTTSALKISLYYRELRDMIQSQYYAYAYPLNYFGYGNQDYGTVKGTTIEYDLRRTGNVRLVANYTLQFAEGTGSSAGSQRDIAIRGNLRSIFPLSFDERHRFTMTMDYRYKSGRTYNGPTWRGKQIFANAGVNLLAIAASGRPYSRAQIITAPFSTDGVVGGYNAARLPWNTRLDLRIDKNITLQSGQAVEGEKAKRAMFVNVYFRVQNLLDTKNILGVYNYSQSPYDTGYLNSPLGSQNVGQITEELRDFYLLSYQWAMLNPGFFTLPRRMYIGATLSF